MSLEEYNEFTQALREDWPLSPCFVDPVGLAMSLQAPLHGSLSRSDHVGSFIDDCYDEISCSYRMYTRWMQDLDRKATMPASSWINTLYASSNYI